MRVTYQDLLGMCKRAASVSPEAGVENLLDVIQILNNHSPFTRSIAVERLVFLMAEFIEEPTQIAARAVKH
jgi:hypothetical protein